MGPRGRGDRGRPLDETYPLQHREAARRDPRNPEVTYSPLAIGWRGVTHALWNMLVASRINANTPSFAG